MAIDKTSDPFDPETWSAKGFTERVHLGAQAYLVGGMGYRVRDYTFHAVKLALFILGWIFFCSFTPGLGTFDQFTTWIFEPVAFQKAFLWGCLCEVAGFACMSGPLGLRIWPPFTACLHFLRAGTTKFAPFPKLPLFGGATRSFFDVALYAGLLVALLWSLVQPQPNANHFLAVVIFFLLAGLCDRTILLAGRVEHHFAMIVCFLLAGNWIAAAKWVALAIWFWAGVSKLTRAFPYVVPIMTTNNSLLKSQLLRRNLFVNPPDDMNPSALAKLMAHAGGFLEFATPLTLLFVTERGPLLYLGLLFMLMLHGFIISNLPIAAVFEWNFLTMYSGFFLFYGYPEVSLFAIDSWPLVAYLLVAILILPVIGNLFPSRVSFLVAMRYYAGNWAWNAWLFRDKSYRKLNQLKRAAPLLLEQQQLYRQPADAVRADTGFLTFRAMHLQGRALGLLLPRAIDNEPISRYTYADGETVAGSVLGWNFGEGHLADERLLALIQQQCEFEPGEVRVICVEAQPMFQSTLHWRLVDAATGPIDEGYVTLDELAKRAPWDYGQLEPSSMT